MIDADRYWAVSELSREKNLPVSSRPKTKPISGITAEQLTGGCLLYRLRGAPTRLEGNIATSDEKGASANFPRTQFGAASVWSAS